MDTFLAFLTAVLALFGVHPAGSTFVHEVRDHGRDVVYARATSTAARGAVYECIDSTTGGCHFLIEPASCGGRGARTCGTAIERFVLPAGHARRMPAGGRVRVCMGSNPRDGACEVIGG